MSRLISLAGVKWSYLRIDKQASPPQDAKAAYHQTIKGQQPSRPPPPSREPSRNPSRAARETGWAAHENAREKAAFDQERETEILVAQQPPQGVLVCDHAGLVINNHPGGNPGANLMSISHRCHPILVAFVWELTKETIDLPLG